jgi:hypothetical protein
MTNEELANELLKEWVLLPPTGCVVRAKQPCDDEPREYRVDGIEIEIDLSFSLVQIDEAENGEYFDPENIIEFISIEKEWYAPNLWWRCPRGGKA